MNSTQVFADAYKARMEQFLHECATPPSTLLLRQQHQLIAFEIMDEFRKHTAHNDSHEWQLEAQMKNLLETFAASNRSKKISSVNSVDIDQLNTVSDQIVIH